ncbi:TPX2, C-terminal [Dillenia turbinata]|uniref:TPX2, C-terminal n=1 Tax=Dillenia turbinata TaxID=194707 RepID=A0AAN8UXL0_9MAGN
MELIDIFIITIVAILLHLWWRHFSTSGMTNRRQRNLPPGPPGWPIFGNLMQVVLQKRPFIFIIRELRKKYGPIFTMQMGQRTLIIVTSAQLIHEALVQKGPTFASRPPESQTRKIFSAGRCSINSAKYGPLWRSLRRNFVTELINPVRIQQCGWIRKWAIENHINRLKTEAAEKGFVEVMSNCRLTICSILICICFGAKICEEKIKTIETVLKEVMMMTTPKLPDFLPMLTHLFRGQLPKARELRRKQMECLVPLVRKRREFVENGGNPCAEMASPLGAAYIDSLFRLEPPGRGSLVEEELVTLCSEAINAGTDTSATTVEWTMLHLVLNQDMQQKLYDEIVATKLYLIERQRKLEEKIQKIIEEEEVRMLRKEMIPRAQLMPLFDRPFFPQR